MLMITNGWTNRLRRDMDRLFEEFQGMTDTFPTATRGAAEQPYPLLNAWETEHDLRFEAEVPGIKRENIDVSVSDNQLTIKGERKEACDQGECHRAECSTGSFCRVVPLPGEVEPGKVQADLKDGVLTIKLSKSERAKPRRIPVRCAD